MLLWGQLPVLAQFPSQVQARFRVLQGFALGRGLRIFDSFQVAFRVNPTSLACDFSFSLPVVVIDGLYELMEIQQGNRPVMMHHLFFDAAS